MTPESVRARRQYCVDFVSSLIYGTGDLESERAYMRVDRQLVRNGQPMSDLIHPMLGSDGEGSAGGWRSIVMGFQLVQNKH